MKIKSLITGFVILVIGILLTGCTSASAPLSTSKPTESDSSTATATPTNTPEPTLTPTLQPYYLEESTLYHLYGSNGGYMVVCEDIASLETSADGILTAYDAEGMPRFELVDGEWVEVVIEWEYVILAATDEERAVLEDFTANFLTEYEEKHGEPFDFESIPEERRIHLRNVGQEEDLGLLEYGLVDEIWKDTIPEYAERYRSMSSVTVGVAHIPSATGGMDKIVEFSPTKDGRILVNVIDMDPTGLGQPANMYAAEYVPVDINPVYYTDTDGSFSGVSDVDYIEAIKTYFADGGEPFQSFVYYVPNFNNEVDKLGLMWDDLKAVLAGELDSLQNDYGLPGSWDMYLRGIAIPDGVAAEMGMGE